jgi:membrane protease YdiL (CAAX protease family)
MELTSRIKSWQRWIILTGLIFAAGALSSFLQSKIGYLEAATLIVPTRVLLRVFPFFVFFLGYKLRLVESEKEISTFRWALFFGLIIGGILLFTSPEINSRTPFAVPASMNALLNLGRGWLLPGILLAVFALLIAHAARRGRR